jgi:acetyltransferase-like isoleucine patch superfamily enzyme
LTPAPTQIVIGAVKKHPLALCESDSIGAGTRIWAHAHILPGAIVGSECNIGDGVFIEGGARVGDRCTVKNQVMIWDGVTLEDDVFVGPGVIFTNDAAPRSPRMPQVRTRYRCVENWRALTVIRRGASLGAGAIILPGVEIGNFALIGAGSVVTRNVPPHHVVVGNPARQIGWVCACGLRLDEQQHCEECNVTYDFPPGPQRRKAG